MLGILKKEHVLDLVEVQRLGSADEDVPLRVARQAVPIAVGPHRLLSVAADALKVVEELPLDVHAACFHRLLHRLENELHALRMVDPANVCVFQFLLQLASQ